MDTARVYFDYILTTLISYSNSLDCTAVLGDSVPIQLISNHQSRQVSCVSISNGQKK